MRFRPHGRADEVEICGELSFIAPPTFTASNSLFICCG